MDKSKFKIRTGHFANTTEYGTLEILNTRVTKNTRKSSNTVVNILIEYLAVKNMENLSDISDEDLPQLLQDFYTNSRTHKSEMYNIQSMKSMHSNLATHLKITRKIYIVNDVRFLDANEMFSSMKIIAKRYGKGLHKSITAIDDCDLKRMTVYFNNVDHVLKPDPYKLQQFVLYNVIYYTC